MIVETYSAVSDCTATVMTIGIPRTGDSWWGSFDREAYEIRLSAWLAAERRKAATGRPIIRFGVPKREGVRRVQLQARTGVGFRRRPRRRTAHRVKRR